MNQPTLGIKIGCFKDIPMGPIEAPFAKLCPLDIYNLADRPAGLSRSYREGNSPDSYQFADVDDDLIRDGIMRELDGVFLRDFTDHNRIYLNKGFRNYILQSLKDPGFLYYLLAVDFVHDPIAISYEWHRHLGHQPICRSMLEGVIYDVDGNRIPYLTDSAWLRMVAAHGTIYGLNRLQSTKAKIEKTSGYDLKLIDYALENPSLTLLRDVLHWQVLPPESGTAVASIEEAIARAKVCIDDLNHAMRLPDRQFVLDHYEVIHAGLWGDTHVRVFARKIKLS